MDWRRRFTDYKAARGAYQRAQACLAELEGRLVACAAKDEKTALEEGVAVAKRRLELRNRALDHATAAFTQGRSVLEAIWSAPDDV